MRYILSFLICFLALSGKAYTVLDTSTGLIRESATVAEPTRTVEKLVNGIKVTYEFPEIMLVSDPLIPGAYYPSISGFGLIETETQPWVPVRIDKFAVNDSGCEIQILEDQTINVSLVISPARAEHDEYEDFVYTADNLPAISRFPINMPSNIVESNRTDVYRDTYIKTVKVSPIQYNPVLKRVCVHKKFSYLVADEETDATDGENERILHGDPIMANLVNGQSGASKVLPIRYSTPAPIGLLIVSHDDLSNCVNQIVNWKKRLGYTVEYLSSKKWTPEQIKKEVKEYYDKTPYAYYLLIIGDDKLVPSEKFISSISAKNDTTFYSTDLYYACMDGADDNMPDLCYGRIPVSTEAEGLAVFDKMTRYDGSQGKPDNEVTRFMGAAYFQDFDNNGVEDYYYVRTVESICTALESKFDAVDRIYCKGGTTMPKAWNSLATYEEFPEHLKTESAWQGNANDIINSFNANCNLILHRDHGLAKGWDKPSFTTADLSKLENTVYPIVLSMNCHTGDYTQKDNFAKTILSQKVGGAVAVVGATTASYTTRNDLISMALIKSIWPDLELRDFSTNVQIKDDSNQPANSIGDALLVGLAKMEEVHPNILLNLKQRRMYHCLGDPSLSVYWNKDNLLERNLTATYNDGVAEISLGGISAYISVWDAAFGPHFRVYGNYLKYETFAGETMVTISKPGYRPLLLMLYSFQRSNQLSDIAALASIKSTEFRDDELSITIENADVAGMTLTVLETDNVAAGGISTTMEAEAVSGYLINNPSNRFYYIVLRRGDEIIDSKSIFKK